jgi:hypothetical protein
VAVGVFRTEIGSLHLELLKDTCSYVAEGISSDIDCYIPPIKLLSGREQPRGQVESRVGARFYLARTRVVKGKSNLTKGQ